jgi:ParB-like chromosome segregation protein Spo0J
MNLLIKKIAELINYEKNARTHPQKQIDLLAKNIEKFGFTTPVLIDKNNTVIAGHGRLLAMKQLNRDEVPCVLIDYLNDKEIKALRLADNQITAMSDWDIKRWFF